MANDRDANPAARETAADPLTDEALALLLAEYDRCGDDARTADRLRQTQDDTIGELSAPSPVALPLQEHRHRESVREEAGALAERSLERAAQLAARARQRRRQILTELALALPPDEWVASGEWALFVRPPSGETGCIVYRALTRAVARANEMNRDHDASPTTQPHEIVALSRAMELAERPAAETSSGLGRVLRMSPYLAVAAFLILFGVGAAVGFSALIVWMLPYSTQNMVAIFALHAFGIGLVWGGAKIGREALEPVRDLLPLWLAGRLGPTPDPDHTRPLLSRAEELPRTNGRAPRR